MINLNQYPKIKSDIESKSVTSLIYLFQIQTNPEVLIGESESLLDDGTLYFRDKGLEVRGIKESIDISSSTFKTSKVTINVSNYPIPHEDGVYRLSDEVFSKGLINKISVVYFKTPSCTNLEDCIPIYKGKIKRLDYDDRKIKIQLEDYTETFLSKEVPIANIKNSVNSYNEDYLNRPIPITYGVVDRAPAIPWVNKDDHISENNIRIICDDTIDTTRDINLTGFVSSEQQIPSSLETEGIDPLYVHKGAYYNVLETFKSEVLQEDDSEDWAWSDSEQYTVHNNELLVTKKFSGVNPLNPSAFNEIMCVYNRYPTQCLVMGSPEGDSITDINGVSIQNIQTDIVSPELAIDNPISLPNSSKINPDYPIGNHFDTRAIMPDISNVGEDTSIVSDFRIHRNYASGNEQGIYHNQYESSLNSAYHFKLFEWLNINMHNFNYDSIENPRVVYKQLPSMNLIAQKVNFYLDVHRRSGDADAPVYIITPNFDEWVANSNTNFIASVDSRAYQEQFGDKYRDDFHSGEGVSDYITDDKSRDNQEWWYNLNENSPAPQVIFLKFKIQNDYRKSVFNGGVGYDYIYVSLDNGSFNIGSLLDTSVNLDEYMYTNEYEADSPSTSNESELANDIAVANSLYNTTGQSMYFSLFNTEPFESPVYNPSVSLGMGYYAALEYNPDLGGLVFNPYSGFLFADDQYAEYSPFEVSNKGFFNSGDNYFTSYRCVWNDVPHGANVGYGNDVPFYGFEDDVAENGVSGLYIATATNHQEFYGAWGYTELLGYGETNNYLAESILQHQNTSYVILIKEQISEPTGYNYSDSETDTFNHFSTPWGSPEEGANGENSNLILTPFTMLPTTHWIDTGAHHQTCMVDFTGYLEFNGDEAFAVSDYDAASGSVDRRVSLVFPLEDITASDNLLTETFFNGKVICDFITENNETTDTSNASFQLNIGAVDTGTVTEEGTFEVDFESLDEGLDAEGNQISNVLINRTLSDCNNLSTQMYSSLSSDYPQYDDSGNVITNQSNLNFIENSDGLLRINQFWEINNFNAFTFIYRLDNGNIGTPATNESDGALAVLNSKIHSASIIHFLIFEKAFDSPLYVNVNGRANSEVDTIEYGGEVIYKYTGSSTNREIISPIDIMYHFIEKELSLEDELGANYNHLQKARQSVHTGDKYGFSIYETMEGKDFLKDFSTNTQLFPKFSSNSNFDIIYIKSSYADGDVNSTIVSSDIIRYKFKRTPIEDINTIVSVQYKLDYEDNTLKLDTGYVDGYDMFGNGDGTEILDGRENGYSYDYLGLNRDDNVLEFEANYIRDEQTALNLRNYIYMNNCNQHNIIEVDLPIIYLHLEVGDIIKFDSLVYNTKAYGEDYTEPINRNGQLIYPYFIIEKLEKKSSVIKATFYQLHDLTRRFTTAMGSTTRMLAEGEVAFRTLEDWALLDTFISDGDKYYTRDQKRVSDVTWDGALDVDDLNLLLDMTDTYMAQFSGDINGDGVVNVVDIVNYVQYILGSEDIPDELLEIADWNGDGIINVIDIISTVNQILGGE